MGQAEVSSILGSGDNYPISKKVTKDHTHCRKPKGVQLTLHKHHL